jgi:putative transposase
MAATRSLSTEIGIQPACAAFGLARSGFYRGREPATAPAPRPSPPRTLSSEERQAVLAILHSDRFVDQAPATVYATLLDEGRYHCSIRTLYRLLDEQAEVKERRNQLRHPVYQKPELLAIAPNQVWSWDITKLLGPVKWTDFHLYVILDIFSRYVTGWMVAPRESATLAQRLIAETCAKQGVGPGQLFLHADRGTSMTSKPVARLLADLGVTRSHSRPQGSNDNPFSEAQFKTLKYRPEFPERFGSIEDARVFCQRFFSWYNGEHHHSGIGLMTPAAVHDGRAATMRDARQQVLMTAYAAHPERFVRQPPQPAILPHAVWINPPKEPSASQDRPGSTISTAADQRIALNREARGVLSEAVVVSPHVITTSTDEVLH